MNTIRIHRFLTKHVKYFQGDLLPTTLIKFSIIVINLDKHYMPCLHWVAVFFPTLGTPNMFIRTDYHHTKFKSWNTCSATEFLGDLTATDYRI